MLDHATTAYSLEHDPKRSHQTKNRHIKPGYAAMPVRTHDSRTHDKSYSDTAHLAIFAAGPFAAAASEPDTPFAGAAAAQNPSPPSPLPP